MLTASEYAVAFGLGQDHGRYVEAYGDKHVNYDGYISYRKMTNSTDQVEWQNAFWDGVKDYENA